jgi:GntR family transcriptional regulator
MSRPMYQMIAEDLRRQIETDAIQPGQQLRTELELREHYGVSQNTIRDAISWLTTLGLVETKPGQGTVVRRQLDPLVNTIGPYLVDEVAGHLAEVAPHRRASLSRAQLEIQQAHSLVASKLLIPEGAEVISRHQRRFVDDAPWSMQTAFYPRVLYDRGAVRLLMVAEIETGILFYLHDTLGIRMETWRVWLTARRANATEADFFQLPPGGAVVEIFQTYYEPSGTPFCLTVAVYPPDRNLFQVTAGNVPSVHELRQDLRPQRCGWPSTTMTIIRPSSHHQLTFPALNQKQPSPELRPVITTGAEIMDEVFGEANRT